MNYVKLFSAKRKSGPQPTLEPLRLTCEQQRLSEAGCCIECGAVNSDACSFLCKDCQGKDTIEDIRKEIAALRRSLLNKPKQEMG